MLSPFAMPPKTPINTALKRMPRVFPEVVGYYFMDMER
jgi:hypothetical protein